MRITGRGSASVRSTTSAPCARMLVISTSTTCEDRTNRLAARVTSAPPRPPRTRPCTCPSHHQHLMMMMMCCGQLLRKADSSGSDTASLTDVIYCAQVTRNQLKINLVHLLADGNEYCRTLNFGHP